MKKKLIILFVILINTKSFSQRLSTLFIDSLTIIVSNDTIYKCFEPKIHFLNNYHDTTLAIYSDKSYKLNMKLMSTNNHYAKHFSKKPPKLFPLDTNKYTFLYVFGYPKFTINNKSISFKQDGGYINIKNCDDYLNGNYLKNWRYDTLPPKNQTIVKINYRFTNMSPADTTHYKYPYRQGEWVGAGDDVYKLTVNYKNDIKNGEGIALYNDNRYYKVIFENGVIISQTSNMKSFKVFHIPEQLQECKK